MNTNPNTKPVLAPAHEPVAEYAERARAMDAEKRLAVKEQIGGLVEQFKRATKDRLRSAVEQVNLARTIGQQIELFTGHQKLAVSEWQPLAPVFGADAPIEFAKHCLALHHKYPQPLTVHDFKLADEESHRLLVQLDLLPAGVRAATETPPPTAPLNTWICKLREVKDAAVKLTSTAPPEKWDAAFRWQFLNEFAPLHDLAERVRSVRSDEEQD